MADEKMVQNAVLPEKDDHGDQENGMEIDDEEEDSKDEEYEALNRQLDQLNSALDSLESKNDNCHAELIELLKSNRETRKQIQESQKDGTAEGSSE